MNVSGAYEKFISKGEEKKAGNYFRYVHGVEKVVEDPIKIPTPYGGRLVWLLPGKNRLIVHMKDKNQIRHKKRWSQVKTKFLSFQFLWCFFVFAGYVYVLSTFI